MVGFFSMSFANGGEDSKKVVLEEVSKTTQMAFVYDASGVLIEKGLLVKGKREGVWQGFNADGLITAEVTFKNGQKNGVWKIYDQTELVYVLYYQNDQRMMAENLAAIK